MESGFYRSEMRSSARSVAHARFGARFGARGLALAGFFLLAASVAHAAPRVRRTATRPVPAQEDVTGTLHPGKADEALSHVTALLQAGKVGEAEGDVRAYMKTHPDSGRAHFLLGYILFDEIHVRFTEQEKRQGKGFKYNDQVGVSLQNFRNALARASLAQYTAGARSRKPSAFDLKIVALDYILLKDNIAADKWLSLSLSWNPKDAQGWYYLGRTKYSESQFPAAIEAFEQCLELEPKNVAAEYNVGLSYAGLGQDDQAIQAYQNAIAWQADSETKSAEPYILLASIYLDENQPAKAVPNLRQAVLIAPQAARAHEELGKAYSLLHQLPEAEAQLEDAVHLAPKNAPMHCMLGQVYRQEKKFAPAKAEFQACAALQHTTPGGHAPMQ
jgi:tetratricopeptide (TPR) repeat protein